jgi:hypothetical protein
MALSRQDAPGKYEETDQIDFKIDAKGVTPIPATR